MLSKEVIEKLEDLRNEFHFENPNSLSDIISFFQKVILLAIAIEKIDKKITPRLILGEEKIEKDSSKTLSYEQPTISITLTKRSPCGTNEASTRELFKNNLISGKPKFDITYKVKKNTDEEIPLIKALVVTDNELCLILKTKTVKEQLILLPILERALNIYSEVVKPIFVDVCGIKNIITEERKDDISLETAKIYFQLRVKETVIFDKSILIKGFTIANGEEVFTNSGKIDELGKWKDNVTDDYENFN